MKRRHEKRGTATHALPKVCVVDDDPDLLDFFKGMAELGHFHLIGAYAGATEALQGLPNRRPDVVFMDLLLPDMSGIECTEKLIALLPQLRVVVSRATPSTQC
jgi:two-component system chemotaxis response regulator CheY